MLMFCGAAEHSPLVTRATYSKGPFYVGCVCPSLVEGLTTVCMLVGGAGPGSVGCQALPGTRAVGPLVGRTGSWHSWLHSLGVLEPVSA